MLGSPAHLPGITGIFQARQGEDTCFPESPRAPGPKPICRFQVPGCSERRGLLFQEIPMESLDAQPHGPHAIGSAGRARTGRASGSIWCPGTLPRMGLRWDWGLYHGGSAPWQGCSRPQLTAQRTQGPTIRPPQGGGGANYRVVPITGLPGQPCGRRCPPPLVSSSKALGNQKGISPGSPGSSDPPFGDMEGEAWRSEPQFCLL